MKGIIKFFKNYAKDEEGQTAVEYVLLLAVAAMVIFKIKGSVETELGKVISNVFGKITDFANKIQ